MTKRLTAYPIWRHIMVALMWFGISFLWGSFLNIVLPFLILPQHVSASNPALVPADFKNTALAILEGFGLVFALIIQPAAGAFSDKLRTKWGRRRPLLVIGVLVGVGGLLLMVVTFSFAIMIVVYCLLQCGMNIAQGAYQGLLPDAVPPAHRSRASGFVGVMTLLGQASGTISAGFVAPRQMCLVVVAVLVACVFFTVYFVHEEPLAKLPRSATPHSGPSLFSRFIGYFREFKGQHDFLWVVFSRFMAYTGLAIIERYAANYLRDTFHGNFTLLNHHITSDSTATSVTFTSVLLLALIATYPAVAMSRRIGRQKVLIAGACSGGIGSILLIFAHSLNEVALFAMFIGFGFGLIVSVDWAFMVDLSPKIRTGKFLGFSNIATAGSQAAAPTVMGPIIDAVNRTTTNGGYTVMFAASALFFFVGAVILARVKHHPMDEDVTQQGAFVRADTLA